MEMQSNESEEEEVMGEGIGASEMEELVKGKTGKVRRKSAKHFVLFYFEVDVVKKYGANDVENIMLMQH